MSKLTDKFDNDQLNTKIKDIFQSYDSMSTFVQLFAGGLSKNRKLIKYIQKNNNKNLNFLLDYIERQYKLGESEIIVEYIKRLINLREGEDHNIAAHLTSGLGGRRRRKSRKKRRKSRRKSKGRKRTKRRKRRRRTRRRR